jgi:hypothetical protein
MSRQPGTALLAIAVLAPLMVWCCDNLVVAAWVGRTDLDVKFAIVDRSSGLPIPDATIEVQSDGGHYDEREPQQFSLSADPMGNAHKVCRNSLCFGKRSRLRFTDTFAVHLPWWRFRVLADGYEPGDWTELNVLEYQRLVCRNGPSQAKLVVLVSLKPAAE